MRLTFEIREQGGRWWLVHLPSGEAAYVVSYAHLPGAGTLVTTLNGEAITFAPGLVRVREEVGA